MKRHLSVVRAPVFSQGWDPTEIHISFSLTADWAMPGAVVLRSAEKHLSPGSRIVAHIFVRQFSPELRQKVESSLRTSRVTIQWHTIDLSFLNGFQPPKAFFPAETYFRLGLGDFLEDLNRVLWIDADTLILSDLTALWNSPLGNSSIAATTNFSAFRYIGNAVACCADHGLDPKEKAFNAGVLLIDLEAWRKNDLCGQALKELALHGAKHFAADQDILNVLCYQRHETLDPTWNVQTTLLSESHMNLERFGPFRFFRIFAAPKIVHFNCYQSKPWLKGAESPYRFKYWKYIDETEWRGTRPEGVSPGGALLNGYHVAAVLVAYARACAVFPLRKSWRAFRKVRHGIRDWLNPPRSNSR